MLDCDCFLCVACCATMASRVDIHLQPNKTLVLACEVFDCPMIFRPESGRCWLTATVAAVEDIGVPHGTLSSVPWRTT